MKCQALTEADTIKTESQRGSTSAFLQYKSKHGSDSVLPMQDVDHARVLQLGGADSILNMNPLDRSVNRSLGSQISYLIKNLDFGTVINNFSMS